MYEKRKPHRKSLPRQKIRYTSQKGHETWHIKGRVIYLECEVYDVEMIRGKKCKSSCAERCNTFLWGIKTLHIRQIIPLTNRVREPFCKLRTEFFCFRAWAINPNEKSSPQLTIRTEKNEDIYYISWFKQEGHRFLFKRNGHLWLTRVKS